MKRYLITALFAVTAVLGALAVPASASPVAHTPKLVLCSENAPTAETVSTEGLHHIGHSLLRGWYVCVEGKPVWLKASIETKTWCNERSNMKFEVKILVVRNGDVVLKREILWKTKKDLGLCVTPSPTPTDTVTPSPTPTVTVTTPVNNPAPPAVAVPGQPSFTG
jgi:hypothetical protein